jgi:hypothetical protein
VFLHHAGREAALPEQRRLLIARDPGDQHGCAEQPRLGLAEDAARRPHLRHHRRRDVEEPQQLGIPHAGMDVEQQRARRVRRVGDVRLPGGELPDEPAVDRSEREIAGRGPRARAAHVVEDPRDLGRREIRVEHEARLGAHLGLGALVLQARADVGGSPVLPHDGAMDRLPGAAVPHDRRLALVRDADGGERGRFHLGFPQRLPRDRERDAPDLLGVVLHPAGLRVVLLELRVAAPGDPPAPVEDEHRRARRALVDRHHVRRLRRHPNPPEPVDPCAHTSSRARIASHELAQPDERPYHRADMPRRITPERIVTEAGAELGAALGSELRSVVLYGSAETSDFRPERSDLNFAAVAAPVTFAHLQRVAQWYARWRSERVAAPLLLAPSDLTRSLDVFPLEMLDIQARHRTLAGDELFGT